MYILFIDACPTTLAKNFLPLANFIKQKEKDFKACFVSLELASYTSPKVEQNAIEQLVQNSNYKYVKLRSLKRSRIENFLITETPDSIFTNGYRIYDQLWIGIAKQLNISSYHLQQGFEIDSVYFKPFSILLKLSKSIKMSYALYGISCITKSNFINLLLQYIRHIFQDKTLNNTALCNEMLHPQKSFVYSEFYKEFWNNKFEIEKESMVMITPTDFLLIPNIRNSKRQKACCYITQTLVEDGRMTKKEFIKHLSNYKTIASHTEKLIIKLHPRANVDYYYKIFKDIPNVEFTREFPNCTVYITHYSSMAYTAAFFSNLVILHELKGHPTPNIFKKIASFIVFDIDQITKILDTKNVDTNVNFENKKKTIEYYAVYDNVNPYETIYTNLKS